MLFPRPVGPSDIVTPWGPEQIGPAVRGQYQVGQPSQIYAPPYMVTQWSADQIGPAVKGIYRTGQPSRTDAPPFMISFSNEMVLGAMVTPRPHLGKGYFFWMPPDPVGFPIEATYGWRVYPVLPKLDRTGWSAIQPTQVSAPFSEEMVAGAAVTAHLPVQGQGLFTKHPLEQSVPFSQDSTYGWHPDQPRLPLLDRRGWSAIQPTPVAAPFSQEMVAGASVLPRPHILGNFLRVGYDPESIPFPPESTFGWHPDQPRLPKLDRTGWSAIQPTPVAAPFGEEMVVGIHPDQPRILRPPVIATRSWWTFEGFAGIFITVRNFVGKTSTQTVATTPGIYVIGPPQFTINNFVSTISSIVLSGSHQGLYIREQEPTISADGNPWYRWEEDQPLIGVSPTNYRAGVF